VYRGIYTFTAVRYMRIPIYRDGGLKVYAVKVKVYTVKVKVYRVKANVYTV